MKKEAPAIIEGICYLFPHKQELLATSLSMAGTWKHTLRLLARRKNTYLAPLLVDDLVRTKTLATQTVEGILRATVQRSSTSLPWFGEQVLESEIEKQYGNLGCKIFDSIYHRDVILSLELLSHDWTWTMVHPALFKKQQAGMLVELWKLMAKHINMRAVANTLNVSTDIVREKLRAEFLSRFEHHWIAPDGTVESVTKPVYRNKKIEHLVVKN